MRLAIIRALQLALLSILVIVVLGATDASARFDRDSHQIMCTCSCNELLGECNHLGCPDSPGMRTELTASIAQGKSDDAILHQFQREYGPAVLAAPRFTSFNHLAWILPPLLLLLGFAVTMLLVRRWKKPEMPLPAPPGIDEAIRNRVRRETQL